MSALTDRLHDEFHDQGLGKQAVDRVIGSIKAPGDALTNITEPSFLASYNTVRLSKGLGLLQNEGAEAVPLVKGWLLEEFRAQYDAGHEEHLAEVRRIRAIEVEAEKPHGELVSLRIHLMVLLLLKNAAVGNLGIELPFDDDLRDFLKHRSSRG